MRICLIILLISSTIYLGSRNWIINKGGFLFVGTISKLIFVIARIIQLISGFIAIIKLIVLVF